MVKVKLSVSGAKTLFQRQGINYSFQEGKSARILARSPL